MNDAFIYGYAVEGENFTDRKAETKRLKANFEHGVNTLLISNRRIGKTCKAGNGGAYCDGKRDLYHLCRQRATRRRVGSGSVQTAVCPRLREDQLSERKIQSPAGNSYGKPQNCRGGKKCAYTRPYCGAYYYFYGICFRL